MRNQRTVKERLDEVFHTLIDELESREDLGDVPVKDLLASIMTTAKLMAAVETNEGTADPIRDAIKALKSK